MICPYVHSTHFEQLKAWNDARGQMGLEQWMLPDLGYVSDLGAMAFLVTTNSPVAWFAHWTVDPKLNRTERDAALTQLLVHMEQVSKEKGYRLTQTLGKSGYGISKLLSKAGYVSDPGSFQFFVKVIGN